MDAASPETAETDGSALLSQRLLLASVLMVAVNMRPALTSVSPILGYLGASLHLGDTALSLLETIPIICFAALAPAALLLQRRFGTEGAMLAVLVLLVAGLCLRPFWGDSILFGGTALAGAAIAVMNVLLPAIVKRDFSRHVGLVTGLYTTMLNIAAAVGAAISIPLAEEAAIGWRGALAAWAIPAAAALLLWIPQLRQGQSRKLMPYQAGAFQRLVRLPIAWYVAAFMGMQSLTYYAVLSWLPAILENAGIRPEAAGLMLSLTSIIAVPATLAAPSIAARMPDQRLLLTAVVGLIGVGFLGLSMAPAAAPWIWSLLIGFGQGAAFPLALTLIVLRAHGSIEAMSLSAFSQTIGYAIAVLGPLGLGAIHLLAGWTPACWVLTASLIPQLAAGLAAARDRTIQF